MAITSNDEAKARTQSKTLEIKPVNELNLEAGGFILVILGSVCALTLEINSNI